MSGGIHPGRSPGITDTSAFSIVVIMAPLIPDVPADKKFPDIPIRREPQGFNLVL